MRRLARLPLFSCGFRPMFLAAAVFAMLAIPAWIGLYVAGRAAWGDLPAQLWHGHEMLFGVGLAAVAGFLLTAVPNWTGTPFRAGAPLLALLLAWCAARGLFALGPGALWPLAACAELAFLPGVAALIAPPLRSTGNRNVVLLFALGVLWACDATFVWAIFRADVLLASRVLQVALDLLLLLVTVIGGRIVPAFTTNALRRRGVTAPIRSTAWLERGLPAAMAVAALLDALAPLSMPAGLLAAALAAAQAWRLSGWQGLRTRPEPILWSLHLAYAWMPLGLALKAAYVLTGADAARHWMHALAAGAIATMVFAVFTRVALGHTGRPLVVRPSITAAYLLLHAGVLVRVLLPPVLPGAYEAVLAIAAGCWAVSFLMFLVVYAPILCSRRADESPA